MIKVEVWNSLCKRDVDAVIVPIAPDPGWSGWGSSLDHVIKSLSGTLYYGKLMAYYLCNRLSLKRILLVEGSRDDHKGTFDHVMFVPLTDGPAVKTLYRALIFAHKNDLRELLVPLSPHWLHSRQYFVVGREYPGQSFEILQTSLALAEQGIDGLDLTVNFAPCYLDAWGRRLIGELKEEYGQKKKFWQSVRKFFS